MSYSRHCRCGWLSLAALRDLFSTLYNLKKSIRNWVVVHANGNKTGQSVYEGWMTEGPARTSESATDLDLVIIIYTSPERFWGTMQLPLSSCWN
jgi:hypothetical protein